MTEENKYKDIDPETILVHRLASYYGWTYEDIKKTPWQLVKNLLKLLDCLESDENAFVGPYEVAGFKNLVRRFKPKPKS